MNAPTASEAAFWLFAALTIAGALVVARSQNIVHSAFALLGTFLGVAGLYALLDAELMAVVQLLVYVGGVLVLILFAVMLTARIGQAETSNPSFGAVRGLLGLLVVSGPLTWLALRYPWEREVAEQAPVTAAIGAALLDSYVLPFEVVSVLLLAALVGAVTIARGPERTPPAPGARTTRSPGVASPSSQEARSS